MRNDRIQALPLATFLDNYNLFGDRFIRDAALDLVKNGETTLEEVNRVTTLA